MGDKNKSNIIINILENFIILMIFLVLIQTFLEDFSVIIGLKKETIRLIRLSSIFFDLLFTIEFIVRMISSASQKRGIEYFFFRNGWIDLLSSIPLLLLVSGPFFIEEVLHVHLASLSFLNAIGLIKLIKAIRITRILRFLRVLKIFGKIKNTKSEMAQQNVLTVTTIVIMSIILFLITVKILETIHILPSKIKDIEKREISIKENFEKLHAVLDEKDFINTMKLTSKFYDNIYLIEYKNKILYNDLTNKNPIDITKKDESISIYQTINDNLKIVFTRENFLKEEALANLLNFFLIIFIMLVLLLIYTRHFALTISDPVYVMRQGFDNIDYTLAVKIPKYYEKNDMFLLANSFNNRWLPAKIRKLNEIRNKSSKLSFNEVFKNMGGK
ncbi:MAG TPA: ion transporter [Spirochaetota bacterium]|nr:ion transporter [Spirochaetota bacterium]HOL56583.1 ion transporter [Spirochaetota bacterium]HPP04014.1 ion transporter [Spirochaetota bacterium]